MNFPASKGGKTMTANRKVASVGLASVPNLATLISISRPYHYYASITGAYTQPTSNRSQAHAIEALERGPQYLCLEAAARNPTTSLRRAQHSSNIYFDQKPVTVTAQKE